MDYTVVIDRVVYVGFQLSKKKGEYSIKFRINGSGLKIAEGMD